MKLIMFGFTLLAMAGVSGCIEMRGAERAGLLPSGPVRTTTAEPGVIPSGTWLVVRTDDRVRTGRAFRDTIYAAEVARDVLDQDERVLIPKQSPVELAVRSLSYLGPGGAGMTVLALDVRAVTIKGVRYPVDTNVRAPDAGRLGVDRYTAKLVGRAESTRQAIASGNRIDVAAGTLLGFQTGDPLRLRGFPRQSASVAQGGAAEH